MVLVRISLSHTQRCTPSRCSLPSPRFFSLSSRIPLSALPAFVHAPLASSYSLAEAVLTFFPDSTASTWLFPANQAPAYKGASRVLISFTIIIIVFCSLNLLYLRRENRKKASQRDEDERTGKGIDPAEWAEQGDRHAHYVYSY